LSGKEGKKNRYLLLRKKKRKEAPSGREKRATLSSRKSHPVSLSGKLLLEYASLGNISNEVPRKP